MLTNIRSRRDYLHLMVIVNDARRCTGLFLARLYCACAQTAICNLLVDRHLRAFLATFWLRMGRHLYYPAASQYSDIAIRFSNPDFIKDGNNLAIRRRFQVSKQVSTLLNIWQTHDRWKIWGCPPSWIWRWMYFNLYAASVDQQGTSIPNCNKTRQSMAQLF